MNDWLIRSKNGPIIIKHHPTLNVWCLSNGMILTSKGILHHPVVFKGRSNPDKDGYFRFHVDGKTRKIHRMIAETFIQNPDSKPTVDHIDRNVQNNDVSNLRWATDIEQKHNTLKTEICVSKYGFSRWEDPKKYTKITNANYYQSHKAECNEYNRLWKSKNPEKYRMYHNEWYHKNKDKINAKRRKRNA